MGKQEQEALKSHNDTKVTKALRDWNHEESYLKGSKLSYDPNYGLYRPDTGGGTNLVDIVGRDPFGSNIIILVHGAGTSFDTYDPFVKNYFRSSEYEYPMIRMNWGTDQLYSDRVGFFSKATKAGNAIGIEDNYVKISPQYLGYRENPSERVWNGAIRLQRVVSELNKAMPEIPITIISHSMGTIVSLAALTHHSIYGLLDPIVVDNWILMGSPIDIDVLYEDDFWKTGTSISRARNQVRKRIIATYSSSDVALNFLFTTPEKEKYPRVLGASGLINEHGEHLGAADLVKTFQKDAATSNCAMYQFDARSVSHGNYWNSDWIQPKSFDTKFEYLLFKDAIFGSSEYRARELYKKFGQLNGVPEDYRKVLTRVRSWAYNIEL